MPYIVQNEESDTAEAFQDMMNAAVQAAKDQITQKIAAQASGEAQHVSGAAASVQALAESMAAARGWTGTQWIDLNDVEMAEAGWNLNAKNPTSGAYGIAQFIDGPSEYYAYGGNPNTASGQITGFLNYVGDRYGEPSAAWAHEQEYHWYGAGGATSGGWIGVGEHGRELIKVPGGSTVIPNGQAQQMVAGGLAGGLAQVQLEVSASGSTAFEQFMVKALREWVRVKGGGNVQAAFGRS